MSLISWLKCILKLRIFWEYDHTNHYYSQGYFGVMNHYEYDVSRCAKCGLLHAEKQVREVGFQMASWGTAFKGIRQYKL